MERSFFVGRYGEEQSRCRGDDGSFVPCKIGSAALGDMGRGPKMGFLDAMRRPPGYMRGLGLDLPVVGSVGWPRSISFDTVPGLIGIGLGKIGPGLIGGILGRIMPGGEGWTKFIVGGLSGLALLSEKWRRNSYLVGFAITALPDMVEPMLEGVLNAVLGPPAAAAQGARRLGQMTAAEAEALKRAERRLLSSADGGGFVGRDIETPEEILAKTRRVPLMGVTLNDNGLRNIA